MRAFKLNDNIRTPYGEKNMTYGEALRRNEGWLDSRGGNYYFHETGKQVYHRIDNKDGKAYIENRFKEIHSGDNKWRTR